MSLEDQIEREAIGRMVLQRYSSGYLHAVEANVPVTYVAGNDIVCEQDGQKIVIAHVEASTKLQTPKFYSIK